MLRITLFVLGLLTFLGLIWHIGLDRIWDAMSAVGPLAVLSILLPSVLMYALEAFGWQLTLGPFSTHISFGRLWAVRTAGEVVNMTTPAAYVGGEPLKAYLIKPQGIPLVDGLASVVTAKTIMTMAQVLFIFIGIVFALFLLHGTTSTTQLMLATGLSLGLLLCGTAGFFFLQRRGLFISILKGLRAIGIRIAYLEQREVQLRELDQTIMNFYCRNQRGFVVATVVFFIAWLAEALEVYVIIFMLGEPIDPLTAIAIGALSVFIKGGTFFIPGSVGAQEGGNLALLLAFGYGEVTGIAFALLRRVRELVWIGIGLVCLMALGGKSVVVKDEEMKNLSDQV